MCIAGFVAVDFEGWTPIFERYDDDETCYVRRVEDDGRTRERLVSYVAREALGLTATEAGELFAGTNRAEAVRRIADEILEGKFR
jgi:hypothetical protein